MIVSYHPCYTADKNMLCAGRALDTRDLDTIKAADAVILPQGVNEALFKMAKENCAHVFPNVATRFDYPGKMGQIKLFRETLTPHPESRIYSSLSDFYSSKDAEKGRTEFVFPFVFKLDWGGEGETVYLVNNSKELDETLQRAGRYEKTGQYGFIVQEYIPSGGKTCRVVVIGKKQIAYWTVQKNPEKFGTHASKGAFIDHLIFPEHQCAAKKMTATFCEKTGINLAGFDFIFPEAQFKEGKKLKPLILEINYYFGRRGLGGSEAYYDILESEIRRWLDEALRIRSE